MLMRKMKANVMLNATKQNRGIILLCLIIKMLPVIQEYRLPRGGAV